MIYPIQKSITPFSGGSFYFDGFNALKSPVLKPNHVNKMLTQ